jgi:glycerol-3-phosphate dehydrogenase
MNRDAILSQIKQLSKCDLLVVGGGATGCGIAVDAASRGLSVVLVEQNDFAEGTSGRSSKLVHGGVRYLEMAVKRLDRDQYQLVKEGLHERFYFLRNAPHLSHPLPLISPVYRWSQLPYVWIGLKLYDQLAGSHSLGPSGFTSRLQTLEEFPLLQQQNLKGGIRYYDGQFNDSRMTLSLALTAAQKGALIANHLAVTDLCRQEGKIVGALLEERINGDSFRLQAETIVNATGPFADELRQLDDPQVKPLLSLSSGIHILLDRRYPPPKAGLLIAETEDDRVLFVLPWQGRCLVGTTDQPAELQQHPSVADADIDYLLRHLENVLDPPPRRENITASWSGLRPLVRDPKADDSARLLRDFIIEQSPSGLFSIVGGKWTSYRRMAEKLVDRVVEAKSYQASACQTENLPVHGAEQWQPNGWRQLMSDFSLPAEIARYLHNNYGSHADKVAQLAAEGYQQQLCSELPCIEAEVVYACRYELAERASDVIARRLPVALLDTDLAKQAAPRVLQLMAQEYHWPAERLTLEQQLLEQRLTIAL